MPDSNRHARRPSSKDPQGPPPEPVKDATPDSAEPQATVVTPAEPPASDVTVQTPQDEVTKLKAELEQYVNAYKRAAADFQNFKKQQERERQTWVTLANADLILKILPFLDDLDKALQSVTPEIKQTPWYEGLLLMEKKLQKNLQESGVAEIESLGKPFDPHFHEAVIQEEVPGSASGSVTAVLQRGYSMAGRVIRPAMVKVAK